MKSQEELNALKEEVETQNTNLAELTGEELEQVSGGNDANVCTRMVCKGGTFPDGSPCGWTRTWRGDYLGQWFDCPNCGSKGTFYGECHVPN